MAYTARSSIAPGSKKAGGNKKKLETSKKRGACERCFVLRRRCDFEDGASSCNRCLRLGGKCVARVDLRSKRKRTDTTASVQKIPRKNSLPRSAKTVPQQVEEEKHENQIKEEQKVEDDEDEEYVPVTRTFENVKSKDAFDALGFLYAFHPQKERAARLLSKAFRQREIPLTFLCTIAKHLQSCKVHNGAHALADSIGMELDSENKRAMDTSTSAYIGIELSKHMCEEFQPAFALRISSMKTDLIMNPASEYFLGSRPRFEKVLSSQSPFHLFFGFISDENIKVEIWNQLMISLRNAKSCCDGALSECTFESQAVPIADQNGCSYNAIISIKLILGTGACMIFSLKNLTPINEPANAKMSTFYAQEAWKADEFWQCGGVSATPSAVMPARQSSLNSLMHYPLTRDHSLAFSSGDYDSVPPFNGESIHFSKVFDDVPDSNNDRFSMDEVIPSYQSHPWNQNCNPW